MCKVELQKLIEAYYTAAQKRLAARVELQIAEKEASLALITLVEAAEQVEDVRLKLSIEE
jgi:hypothetical protein